MRPIFSMTPEFGGHHFFGPEDQIFYVDQESYLKFAHMNLERSFFFNFCDFHFSLTIFRTRFWPRDTCHVDVQQIRIEGLEKLICFGTKIFKIGPELRELWP